MREYKERDTIALDEAGGYFMKHMNALTVEKLHGKAEIAAELAYRDKHIDELKNKLKISLGYVYKTHQAGYSVLCYHDGKHECLVCREYKSIKEGETNEEGINSSR